MIKNICEHLHVGKEVFCGAKTGDYICYDCKETFSEDPRKTKNNSNK